ncbi:hypothetical protein HCH15_02060 [Corynebacterium testudinoris]|uniref:Secreted protein n=1 Tax=Corynebacterium testudinoris TaxID=136857 RepID=A0A0G3H829_9CORY|nr:hypothetical protein [Corynebacterium testudinoris]AKK08915.1 hypothetical protein CTEST_07390 [Corynebacterium testudinoris]MBX8994970.1 hypothetical protein [Corynebacterium testudinoris]
MKLTSRKALVAAATALALTTSGMSAPAFAAEGDNPPTTAASGSSFDSFPGSSKSEKEGEEGNEQGSSIQNTTADQWKTWIGLFTAIIGALSAGFAFVQKYLK